MDGLAADGWNLWCSVWAQNEELWWQMERGEDGFREGEAAVNEGRRARGGEGKEFNSGEADRSHSGG